MINWPLKNKLELRRLWGLWETMHEFKLGKEVIDLKKQTDFLNGRFPCCAVSFITILTISIIFPLLTICMIFAETTL